MRYMVISIVVVIIALLAASTYAGKVPGHSRAGSDILKDFDENDYVRVQKFIDAFDEGRGDYLLAIPPFIDGGYVIYDLRSDGKRIHLRSDHSRDMYSSVDQINFTCSSIQFANTEHHTDIVAVSGCEGVEDLAYDDQVLLFGFNLK